LKNLRSTSWDQEKNGSSKTISHMLKFTTTLTMMSARTSILSSTDLPVLPKMVNAILMDQASTDVKMSKLGNGGIIMTSTCNTLQVFCHQPQEESPTMVMLRKRLSGPTLVISDKLLLMKFTDQKNK